MQNCEFADVRFCVKIVTVNKRTNNKNAIKKNKQKKTECTVLLYDLPTHMDIDIYNIEEFLKYRTRNIFKIKHINIPFDISMHRDTSASANML